MDRNKFKKLNLGTKFVLIAILIYLNGSLQCQSALLTNLYGKKLSEMTDFANRYLIIPTGSIESSASQTSSNATMSSQTSENLAPKSSPLVASWKSTLNQAQSQAQVPSKLRAALQQTTNGSQQAIDISTSRIQGEPSVSESVSTEFPNPNINNLGHEITKILKKFFLHGYDKRVRPNYSGPPALVNVSFHIIGISSVDEVQMDFTTDFYFRQKWYDPRLEFDPVRQVDELCVGAEFAEKIWLPDTFFANEKTATFHKATTENTFIRIRHTGGVYRSIRLTVTCSCPMDLQYFPMDRQRCKIEIESYGYNTRDIDYRWETGDKSVSLNTKIELPQFKILGFRMGQELQNLSSGDYIRLYCEIHFVRSMGYYLIQIYIPASLIVMISWVSFWLHRNATPARVALGVTTVLTMTTLMSSTNAALPKVSYIKSIDVFLGTCFVMVFASLLEYASVGYIGKRIAMKRKRLQDLKQMQQHHQKVCIAAAASAAAAAAATTKEQQQQLFIAERSLAGQSKQNYLPAPILQTPGSSQTLQRRAASMIQPIGGSKTLQRSKATSSSEDTFEPRSALKDSDVRAGLKRRTLPSNGSTDGESKTPFLTAPPISQTVPQLPQFTSNTEFEVSQAHDMIKICGLTPSAIDKHSRVVFPICFVCFNLMYWIIYGHISQQVEDKGPPLIPFIEG